MLEVDCSYQNLIKGPRIAFDRDVHDTLEAAIVCNSVGISCSVILSVGYLQFDSENTLLFKY